MRGGVSGSLQCPWGRRREEGFQTREETMRGEMTAENTPRLVTPQGVGGFQRLPPHAADPSNRNMPMSDHQMLPKSGFGSILGKSGASCIQIWRRTLRMWRSV